MSQQIPLCILCKYPENITIKICNDIQKNLNIPVFIISDMFYESTDKNINIIHISDEECLKYNYRNANYVIKKECSAWDKMLYYFTKVYTDYSFIWVLENDVFVPSINNFKIMYETYKDDNTDHLANSIKKIDKNVYWFHNDEADFFGGLYRSFNPMCRLSKRLIQSTSNFIIKYNRVAFIEVFFASISHKKNYSQVCLNIEDIRFKPLFDDKEIINIIDNNNNQYNIFHPVKDFELQEKLWNMYKIL